MATYTQHLPSPALSEVSAHSGQAFLPVQPSPPACHYERRLGDTEASYFLPSRESGVNDMYLHLGFSAPTRYVRCSRVRLVWAILRVRHPLLASKVQMHDYEDIRFLYTSPASVEEAVHDADRNLESRNSVKDELIDSYLNGPRTLSTDRLSYLIISSADEGSSLPSPPPTPIPSTTAPHGTKASLNHDILICATHFLGDGMALHQFANDLFSLLGSSKDEKDLEEILRNEWETRCNKVDDESTLPSSLEDRLPTGSTGRFYRAACRVDFQRCQDKLIGGHTFPRRSGQLRRTIVPTISIDAERTKKMLKACKAHGVSISSAYFALCNIAWARTTDSKWQVPSMMYSALNLRPNLIANKALNDSYWYLAIGYFNVVLPSFFPKTGDVSRTFWHRARSAKEQSTLAAKSPMLISRSREMARERGARARVWGKEDDEKTRGVWVPPPPKPAVQEPARAPSAVLIGLSLLGNLDGIYRHANFGDVKMHTLTTGSRQRAGGMLLFGYTFVGKLWVSLGYDENGFEKETVDKFWNNLLQSTDEFLDV
ncbi:uncharacterized protein BT62DRAFT_1071449 [Guyanagaster necrorhizus]|uniref:Uncharacterized protein n=1 Tax=Guyanagaster necrorhizus TaxID=856835 RepID=A0A9P7W522_9AGAR|nr:uncharacterized protein BT62DRAFT_1071449 [Guyanagaster necrorhizus MCA 3950]KAG7452294.1 hypothetical protein BT62DRAFT_1071449 [Guyanagaster necrorhizus MCA 3950]